MRLIGWNQAGQRTAGIYPSHQLRSFFAVKVYGPGHVIAHNAVAYFHDAICISTYGPPDSDPGAPRLVDRHLQQRHSPDQRRLHRVRRRRAQHPRLSKSRRERRPQRLQRPADVRRAGLLLPQRALSRARGRSIQVQREAGGHPGVPQHDDRRADCARSLLERSLPQ